MPEILESAENTLVVISNLHCVTVPTGLRYYYISPEDADSYFATVMNSEVWDNSTRIEKVKALQAATKLIDRLRFAGEKPEGQEYEFPREDEGSEIPNNIQYACAEIAKALLDGIDIEVEIRNLNVESNTIGNAKTLRRPDLFVPEHLRAGIPSAIAWDYLKPYLKDVKKIKIYKV